MPAAIANGSIHTLSRKAERVDAMTVKMLVRAPIDKPPAISDHECAFKGSREYAMEAANRSPITAPQETVRRLDIVTWQATGHTAADIAACPLNPVKSSRAMPKPQPRNAILVASVVSPVTTSP